MALSTDMACCVFPDYTLRRRYSCCRVKFGVPLDQVCKKDIPGPLLVMLLKLNKEGPFKRDVFRAPGHQGNMRKLVHFLQQGRLVNIQSFSVNTIASVLKKFLRKIPGGIFGPENEKELFSIIRLEDTETKLERVHKLLLDLPIYSQHLLVLLFGTFRVIHSNSIKAKTGMSAEALGVSVAPSFFHTCVAAGKTAKMEDVERFKLATKVTTFFIEHFGIRNLFGRENYEYYARLTGRILKVEDEWIFFTYPPVILGCSRDDMDPSLNRIPSSEDEGGPLSSALEKTGSLEIIPENCPLDPQGRLSISLDENQVSTSNNNNVSSSSLGGSPLQSLNTLSSPPPLRNLTHPAGRSEFNSYTCLPQIYDDKGEGGPLSEMLCHLPPSYSSNSTQDAKDDSQTDDNLDKEVLVHERQTERMKHRSEWFLSDPSGLVTVKCRPGPLQGPPGWRLFGERPSSLPGQVKSGGKHSHYQNFNHTPSSVQSAPWTIKGNSLQQLCDESSLVSSPPSSAPPTSSSSMNQSTAAGSSGSSGNSSLRRRLSDKEHPTRPLRRSSSKRKDKENGGLKRTGSASDFGRNNQSRPASLIRTGSQETGGSSLSATAVHLSPPTLSGGNSDESIPTPRSLPRI